MEQAFFDFFKPASNLDSNATPSRYNAPMKSETYKKFVSQRSHAIGVFNGATNELLWVFESKQRCTTLMGIHHSTLMKCVKTSALYLNSFKFKMISSNSLVLHSEKEIGVFLDLVKQKRSQLQSHIEIKKLKKFMHNT